MDELFGELIYQGWATYSKQA